MREQQLTRRKTARRRFGNARPVAEERGLEAEFARLSVVNPAGGIPPLVPKCRMRAVVGGKVERRACVDVRIGDVRARSGARERERGGEKTPAAPIDRGRRHGGGAPSRILACDRFRRATGARHVRYQSSRTARTASAPVAPRAAM